MKQDGWLDPSMVSRKQHLITMLQRATFRAWW